MGYGSLGAVVLSALVKDHDVAVVLTHPTQFRGLDDHAVLRVAEAAELPLMTGTSGAEPAILAAVGACRADAIVSTNWRTTAPMDLLDLAKLGALNVHDALLPKYSGFGAVNWAIRNGEDRTGVTVHMMEAELDSGPVIAQTVVPIHDEDTATAVTERVTDQYVPTILLALRRLENGDRGQPQDVAQRTFYHKIGLEDVEIDWRAGTRSVYNLIRSQSDPFINAWSWFENRRLRIKSARLPETTYCGTPGRLLRRAEGGVAIACGPVGKAESRGLILDRVETDDDCSVLAGDFFAKMGGYLGARQDR